MGSRRSDDDAQPRRWQLVLEPGGERPQVFTVRDAKDAAEVMKAVQEGLAALMRRGGCRSMTIGVHVEGPACDHELGGS